MLLIDNSGSMQRSDPQQWRFSAAKNIAYSLLDHGIGTGQQDRLWVIEFADSPSTLISGLSLSDTESIEQARAEIAKSIKPSPGAGNTDVHAALVNTILAFPGPGTSKHRHVILLTDGKPDLPGVADETLENSITEAVQELDVNHAATVEVLGIDLDGRYWNEDVSAFWRKVVGSENVSSVRSTGGELDIATAQEGILQRWLGIRTTLARPQGLDLVYTSLPLASRILFKVHSLGGAAGVTIQDGSNGTLLKLSSAGVDDAPGLLAQYAVEHPAMKTTYRILYQGHAPQVAITEYGPLVQRISPPARVDPAREIEIRFAVPAFVSGSGESVTHDIRPMIQLFPSGSHDPITLQAKIENQRDIVARSGAMKAGTYRVFAEGFASIEGEDVDLLASSRGMYNSTLEITDRQIYDLVFQATQQGRLRLLPWTKDLTLRFQVLRADGTRVIHGNSELDEILPSIELKDRNDQSLTSATRLQWGQRGDLEASIEIPFPWWKRLFANVIYLRMSGLDQEVNKTSWGKLQSDSPALLHSQNLLGPISLRAPAWLVLLDLLIWLGLMVILSLYTWWFFLGPWLAIHQDRRSGRRVSLKLYDTSTDPLGVGGQACDVTGRGYVVLDRRLVFDPNGKRTPMAVWTGV
jgi:hypothetical protein